MTEQFTWRESTPADEALLFELFAATKAADFAPLGLGEAQLRPLLAMQFRAQQSGYAQQSPNSLNMILCLADGTVVGRHLIERTATNYRGIDLAILPNFQNRGIGTWALQQVQQLAALEGLPFRLRVVRGNRARALYERMGFLPLSADEISFELEWTPRTAAGASSRTAMKFPEQHVPVDAGTLPRAEVLDRIIVFIRGIGLKVESGPVAASAFLPGLQMIANGLRVDEAALLYPGDLLHEAGHLALMTPDRRSAELPVANDAAEEMATLAWSYAAALHIGLPPEIVFHEHGYKGQARTLITEFETNPQCIGLPFLWWLGMTTQSLPGSRSIFPRMLRWLRDGALTSADPVAEALQATDPIPGLRWVRLGLQFDRQALQAEVAAIPETAWLPHFNQREYDGDWSIAALRSRSGAASDIVPMGEAAEFRNTPLLASSPALRAVLDSFDFPLKSVRLMRLHAGATIHEHRDRDLTLRDGELRLHVPIVTSDAVEFVVDGERLPLREGECWYIDFSLPHRIHNGGTVHRIHLVIDAVADASALELLRNALAGQQPVSNEAGAPAEVLEVSCAL